MSKQIKKLLLVFSAMLLGWPAFSQITTASLAGIITDKTGPVAGVTVLAVHQPTGSQYYSVTGTDGSYNFSTIRPGGPYTLTVSMLGYSTVKITDVYAPLGQITDYDVILSEQTESIKEAVIAADASESGMNIRRSGAGTVISDRAMHSLPTTSRALNDVLKLTPQVSSTTNGLAVGGGNYRQSYITVDGASFNNAFGIGGNLPSGGAPISMDAIEQMSVSITPYDVRQSGFTGGAINAITKSGSNDFHASVYNYYTSDQLEGDRFLGGTRSMSRTLNNTLGASIGGPIVKNKLFFFANFEYQWDETAGSSRQARPTDATAWGGNTSYNRPTVAFMDEVKDYLGKTYAYDPGRYQGYSLSTPDWKLMARIDWNINENNHFNIRFSHTNNKYSSSPSTSISPFSSKVYDRNNYGRGSNYALYFESARYYQEQNFTSLAAEINSKISDKVSNIARVTWSHQNEPRSFEGNLFPTVDILGEQTEAGARTVLTTFGVDPFTYGNLRDVHTVIGTDEVTINLNRHKITAGLQFEWNKTKNGYMQGGAGYYVYNSWDDFKNNAQPVAFAITHANRTDLKQVFPSFDYMQGSLYAQDEWHVSDYFNLTYGLRVEAPILPTITGNENKEFLEKAALSKSVAEGGFNGLSTADVPKLSVNFSPRVGFNWDILKNRNLILRGGVGMYTGRIPFVWLVSAAGNSNCLQAQYISETGVKPDGTAMGFKTNVNDILTELYGGSFVQQDLAAPTAATILDKSLKMPSSIKSSLALDGTIPGGIKASLEGIYSHILTDVTVHKLGLIRDEAGVQLPGEPSPRASWVPEGIKNSQGGNITPYYLTNSKLHGYYYSVTGQLRKDFNFGLSLMAAYTYSGGKSLTDGLGDQITSAYNTMTYNRNGSNVDELGYSTYISPNRVIANISYRIDEGRGATTIGLFYEGYNYCYIGNYSYSRLTYTMGNQTGDGGAANVLYIPTKDELAKMPFAKEDNRDAYEAFIASDPYLSAHRGQYEERGGIVAPWNNRINLRVAQDINFNVCRKVHTITIGVDVNNIANLLNPEWGAVKALKGDSVLTYKGGQYTFTAPQWSTFNGVASTWQALLNIRYSF